MSREGFERGAGEKPRTPAVLWGLLALLVLGALGVWIALRAGIVQRVYVYTDRSVLREPGAASSIRSVLWSPPREIPRTPVDVGGPPTATETAPGLSPSSEMLLVVERTGDRGLDIFVRHLRDGAWSHPLPIEGPINSPSDEITPCLSRDSSILLFASNRPGGHGGFDIYSSRLTGGGWEEPRNLGGHVNSPFDDEGPALHPSLSVLAFATRRPRSFLLTPPADWSDVILESWRPGSLELAFTWRHVGPAGTGPGGPGGTWADPRPLPEVSSPADEKDPCFSPSGEFLYFASDRAGGRGGFDLYRAQASVAGVAEVPSAERGAEAPSVAQGGEAPSLGSLTQAAPLEGAAEAPSLRLGRPETLGAPVNSRFDDRSPSLSLGGFAMVYVAADPETGSEVLLQTRTREVEAGIEFGSLPIDAILSSLARISWLLFLAAVFIVSTLLALRYRHVWQFNLLARSALAALFVHALMLYSFYFWVVSGDIAALARRGETETVVTVEKMLQARISLSASRMEVEVPAARPGAVAAPDASAPATSARLVRPPERRETPEPVLLESPPPEISQTLDRSTVEARVDPEDASRALEELAAEKLASPPEISWIEPPLERSELPAPEAKDPASEATAAVEPSVAESPKAKLPEASIAVGPDAPTAGPAAIFEERAARLESVSQGPAVELARPAKTQVEAPVPDEAFLPPLAQPLPEQPRAIAALPVPQQAPRADPEELESGMEPAPTLVAGPTGDRSPSTPVREPPRVRTTELASASSRWRSQPVGIAPLESPLPEARVFPEAPLRPSSRPPPLEGTPVRLPQALPRAEVASPKGSAAGAGLEMAPAPAERHLSGGAPRPGEAASEIAGRQVVLAAAPVTAPSDATGPITASSPAALAEEPSPGTLVRLERVRSLPVPSRAKARLPDSAEGGSAPGEGSPEVADILSPPRASPKKATFQSGQSVRAAPKPSSVRLEPEGKRAADSPERAGSESIVRAIALEYERAASESSRLLSQAVLPAPAATPALEARVGRVPRLPEAPPDLARGADARAGDLRKVRSSAVRRILVNDMGGSAQSEDAVLLALGWLARHQSIDGRWDVDQFDAACQGCRSPGFLVHCDAAITGLALLAFLGQNHHPANPETPFSRNVRAAINWLLEGQAADGLLARDDDRYTMYSHGIATLALSEAFILTRDRRLLEPLERAGALIVRTQNPTTGGWRYKPEPPLRGDTSITGWQVLALTSLRGAGLELPEAVFDRARHWLDEEVAGGAHKGIYGYTTQEEPRVAMVAEGMYARLLLGSGRTDRNIEEAARYIHAETRSGRFLDNLYLLYYGNLALYNYQGWIWEQWNAQVRDFLVKSQRRDGTLSGSWDPTGPWSETGGRVLSTCFAALTLEVYYRYLPLYWRSDGAGAQARSEP